MAKESWVELNRFRVEFPILGKGYTRKVSESAGKTSQIHALTRYNMCPNAPVPSQYIIF